MLRILLSVMSSLTLIAISGLAASAQSGPVKVAPPTPAKVAAVGAELGEQIDAVVDQWLIGLSDRDPQMLGMFRQRDTAPYQDLLAWSGEFAGKHLTACVEVLRITRNARLQEYTRRFVQDLIACQADDGYLGPFPQSHRLTGWAPNTWGKGGETWDAWGHYHAMLGLIAWYELTQDESALGAAKRIADLLVIRFHGGERTVLAIGSPEMNQAIVHSLAKLYRLTGRAKYLELAEEIVAEFAMEGSGNYLQAGLSGVEFFQTPKPRWESLHPILGLSELYWITGNPQYRQAVENLWWSIVKLDRHNNGGFSSGEQAQGDPYHQGAIETCCTIAWAALSTSVLHMTRDSRVADELELSLFNQIQALHSADGSWCTYNTPMDGRRIPSTTDIAFQIRPGSEDLNCCSVNAARGFGLLADWAVLTDSHGLVINFFGASKFEAEFKGQAVRISQQSQYPVGNSTKFVLELARPLKMRCAFRIPHWSQVTEVKLNGDSMPAIAGQYLEIDREWSTGDTVELEFDFRLRRLDGENSCAGMVSLYRGPLLMAHEQGRHQPIYSPDFQSYGEVKAANAKGAWIELAFEGDRVEWLGYHFDDAGIANVSVDGAFVAQVDQFGPQRGTPFAWQKSGLGAGQHQLRIEVSDQRHADSKGSFINATAFRPESTRPEFSNEQLREARVDPGTGQIVIAVGDTREQGWLLVPFREVGRDQQNYLTWFRTSSPKPLGFSKANPSRTAFVD